MLLVFATSLIILYFVNLHRMPVHSHIISKLSYKWRVELYVKTPLFLHLVNMCRIQLSHYVHMLNKIAQTLLRVVHNYFLCCPCFTLRKHAYSNLLKILPPKNEKFQRKNSDIFHIFAQNIDCGYSLEPPRRGGSNKYPQSMFLNRNKKNNV